MTDEWGPQAMEAFLNGLLAGSVRTFQLPAMPSFEGNTAAAGGGGGGMPGDSSAAGGGQEEVEEVVVEEVSRRWVIEV